MWWITGLFFVLTVMFLAGKGSFLIAGYNTASKKEKERYDEKKLCRLMGVCMGIITAGLAVGAWFGEDVPEFLQYFFMILVIVDVLGMVILSNTMCLRKGGCESSEEKRRNRRMMKISLVVTVVIFSFVGIMLTTGNVKVDLDDDGMEIKGSYWPDMEVSWEKIRSVSCTDNIQAGSRVGGLGSFRLQEGNFQNEEYGNYTRYTYVRCKKYIVMETTGGILVVNQRTEKETEMLYEKIRQKMGEKDAPE